VKLITLSPAFLGLTNRINNVRITAIAVPVKNSSRNQLAFSTNPFSANQFATTKILAIRKIVPINPNTIIFLIVKLLCSLFYYADFTFPNSLFNQLEGCEK
jgi:hypothetical protein